MALSIELPKEILIPAIDAAISLRERYIKSAHNPVIKQAYEQELQLLEKSKNTIQTLQTVRDKDGK